MNPKGEALKLSESSDEKESLPDLCSEFVDVDPPIGEKTPISSMSVDVEDYFQVSAFEHRITRAEWNSLPSRLPRNTDRILELFDAADVKATFFVLGWVVQSHPEIVKSIASCGHEIASHGFDHNRVWTQTPKEFMRDVSGTRKALEDTTGSAVIGYRAPSFSIDTKSLWAYDLLQEAGYRYSSSIYPIHHDHYGLPAAPRYPFRTSQDGILEIPLSTIPFGGRNWPCAGGGYFRLLPLSYSRWAIRRISQVERRPVNFYFHPWELDPEQPRVTGISPRARFRHYVNLGRFESRLRRILGEFQWGRIDRAYGDAL